MKYAPLASFAVLALAGCPSEETNASQLWLALDLVETRTKLVEEEPEPY